MRTFFLCSFIIGGMLCVLTSAHAQSRPEKQTPFISLYMSNDIRFFNFDDPLFSDVARHRDLWGLHGGAHVHIFKGVDVVLDIGSSNVRESIDVREFIEPMEDDIKINNRMLSLMGGIKLKSENMPFYINFLSGITKHKYTFVDIESPDLATFDSFTIDGNLNFAIFARRRGGTVISLGARRVFDEDVRHTDVYVRFGILYHLLFR